VPHIVEAFLEEGSEFLHRFKSPPHEQNPEIFMDNFKMNCFPLSSLSLTVYNTFSLQSNFSFGLML